MARYRETDLPEGYKVKIYQKNLLEEFKKGVELYKWQTTAVIFDKDDKEVLRHDALCGPLDNPSRKIGRHVAIGRVLKKFFEGSGNR